MNAILSRRAHELVENGWEPLTTTETTAAMLGRRPFAWWLFLILLFVFPVVGAALYLIFYLATSRATVFMYIEDGEIVMAGDVWLIKLQEQQHDAYVKRQKEIKERGFLSVMWPHLLASLVLIVGWFAFLKWAV